MVESLVHEHQSNAGFLLAVFEGFADGEGAAVFGQQGEMDIESTDGGGSEVASGDDLAVGDDQKEVGFRELEVGEVGLVQFFRFEDGQVIFGGNCRDG